MAKKPVRVSQVNAYLARLIAADSLLSDIAVTGEVSNFKVHGSGHVYFSLKDDSSRLDCFLPAGVYSGLGFQISDGTEVVAEGYVNVYEKGGRYSLTVRRMTSAGQGDLAARFEALKKNLSEKGYFDQGRKRALPSFPLSIAIVTSATGAAVSDMQRIITERNSVADILIFPTLVQGDEAADMISARIRQVNRDFPGVDVMIVGRGGGSSEDLWAFNEEAVADAIFCSAIPVISAVGHEVDFTIADFVADVRAATPSAAAALAAPDTGELREDLEAVFSQVRGGVRGVVSRAELRVRANNMGALIGRLKSGISERRAHAGALLGSMQAGIHAKTERDMELENIRVSLHNAVRKKTERSAELSAFRVAARGAVSSKLERAGYQVSAQGGKLKALNPLGVLSRGYAIVEDEDGRAVGSVHGIRPGQRIGARFLDGRAVALVQEVNKS